MTQAYPTELYTGTQCADLLADFSAVDDAACQLFHEQGYLAIRHGFPVERMTDAVRAIDRIIAEDEFRGISYEPDSGPHDGLPVEERALLVRKLMSFVDEDAALGSLSTDEALLDVVCRLMEGATPELFQDMALLKPPGGREKPWHQDMAYFNVPIDTTVVGVWIALDEAVSSNGALHVLPGSHLSGPQEHFKRRDWQICDTHVEVGQDVVVELPPGGVLLWHGLTHHGSPTNTSAQRRRALQFHYRPTGLTLTTTDERMQHYGGDVRGAQC